MATRTRRTPTKRTPKAKPPSTEAPQQLFDLGQVVTLEYDDGHIGQCVIVKDVYEGEDMVVLTGEDFSIGQVRIYDMQRLHFVDETNNVLLRWDEARIGRLLKPELETQIKKPKGKGKESLARTRRR